MVVVDAYSEVIIMPNTTTQTTIEQLRDAFARWGISTVSSH